jgi:GNAT superfamily N-acetyltransferase
MELQTRRATPKDISQLVSLYMEYQNEEKKLADIDGGRWMINKKGISIDIRDYILGQNKLLMVVVNGDKIVGFILGNFKRNRNYTIKNYGMIDELYIVPEMRGKGLSSKLKDGFIKWFKEKKSGKGAIGLYVMPRNKVAQRAYEKWGFKVSDLKLVKEVK